MNDSQDIPHDSPSPASSEADFVEGLASDDFVRDSLEGDVRYPGAPIRDHIVMNWEALTEPRLSTGHDSVGSAVASFFTREGGWVYLTQYTIGRESKLTRQRVNTCLQDLVSVGRIQHRQVLTGEGHRGHAYRLCGEDMEWLPEDLGLEKRITVERFKQEMRFRKLEQALQDLAALVVGFQALPESLLASLEGISESGGLHWEQFLHRTRRAFDDIGALSDNLLYSGPLREPAGPGLEFWENATDAQMFAILTHQERTGLSDDAVLGVRRRVLQENPGLEVQQLTRHQAHRFLQWFMRQPDAPAPEVDDLVPAPEECCCADIDAAVEAADPVAWDMWSKTLTGLVDHLPMKTVDAWLKGSFGERVEGQDLYVRVGGVVKAKWLEDRLYQSVLRSLRRVYDDQWDVKFEVTVPDCPIHGAADV